MQTMYDELAKYFDLISAASVNIRVEVDFLDSLFTENKAQSVIDIACGTGRHSIALGRLGYQVVGIDYSEGLIHEAKEKLGDEKDLDVKFLVQDVSNIEIGDEVDAAICMWSTFGELPYKQMLKSLKSVLKRGGLLIIDTKYLQEIPVGAQRPKVYNHEKDGHDIKVEIEDEYEANKRTRKIKYTIDGKNYDDTSHMDAFIESELIGLLDEFGYVHLETYYDYKEVKGKEPKRMSLVFKNK